MGAGGRHYQRREPEKTVVGQVIHGWLETFLEPLRNTLPRFDSLKCPKCGGRLRMISMVTEPEPIRAILESMGLPSTPPVPARAGYPSRFDESQLEGCDVA